MRAVFQLLVNELLLERADRHPDAKSANFEAVQLIVTGFPQLRRSRRGQSNG
jgi:hypothetical protein